MISKEQILDRSLNYCLYFLYQFMEAGVPISEDLLAAYITEEQVTLEIPDGCVLHARPASLIAKVVSYHGTPVKMYMSDDSCYAGSIMQVILLAGRNLKERKVVFSGDAQPIADLCALFASRLGEDGLDSLPEQLQYLS
jgi:phosphotransferase system HPr (HPr) family protein